MTLPAHITLEDTFDDWVSDFNTLIDHVGTLGGGTSNTLELTTSTGYKSYVHASIYDGIELIANRIPGSFPAVTPNTSLATASIGIFTYDGDSFIGFNTGNTNGGGDTTRMSISGNGYVGIGTSNPTSLLHVVGSTLIAGALTVSGNASFDTGVLYVDALNNRVGINSVTPAEAFSIESGDATVGIKSSTNNKAFYSAFQDIAIMGVNRNPASGVVTDATKAAATIKLSSAATNSVITFETTTTNNANPTERMRIAANGFVGIATSSPAEVLHVVGNIRNSALAGVGNRAVYSDTNGNLTNSSSDAKLKTDIRPITNALLTVQALQGISFVWQDTAKFGPQRELGVIAQEVQPIVPEVVGTNADGTLSVDYPKLTALLIEGLKDVSQYARTLEARIDALAETVARLAPPT